MLTLYKAGNSICTQKVLMTLAEKGAPYETVNLDLFKNEGLAPDAVQRVSRFFKGRKPKGT